MTWDELNDELSPVFKTVKNSKQTLFEKYDLEKEYVDYVYGHAPASKKMGTAPDGRLLEITDIPIIKGQKKDGIAFTNKSGTACKVLFTDKMIYVDDLGAFHFDDGNDACDWNAMNVLSYIPDVTKGDTKDDKSAEKQAYKDSSSAYSNLFNEKVEDGSFASLPFESKASPTINIFLTYVYAGLYDESNMSYVGKLGTRMSFDNMPPVANEPIGLDDTMSAELMDKTIKEWIYYLLHPQKGLSYFRILIKNKIGSFLLGWHNDMLGTYGVGATAGVTRYRNTTGYLSTPELSEI